MRLFIEDVKEGYMDVIDNVDRVSIEKHENKNALFVYTDNTNDAKEIIPLNEIRLAFMVDITRKDCKEYFRYQK